MNGENLHPSRVFVVPSVVVVLHELGPGMKDLPAVDAFKVHIDYPLLLALPDDRGL